VRTVGVIGLGAGSLAAYGRPGDEFTFFEIDPVVIRIARDARFFTFLSDSQAAIEVVEGDGRLRIAQAHDASFDLIVLDAFSSDAVPAHLLTREAFALYAAKLRPGGAILVHVTNTYLDLRSVVAGAAAAAGLTGVSMLDLDLSTAEAGDKEASEWVLLAPDPPTLALVAADPRWQVLDGGDGGVLWTDDFSDLLSVVRW
jgi:predicted methyltransferase